MKDSFLEFHPLEDIDINSLWKDAIFIFDTNVLLNLYRYSDNTSEKFIQVISDLKERVWIPYQVGLEFYKNRLSVISDQKKNYSDFEKKVSELIAEVESQNRNPFFSDDLCNKLQQIKKDITKESQDKVAKYENRLKSDQILDNLNGIFNGKIGKELKVEDLKKIYSEGDQRFKDKIPPGYQDIKKDGPAKYGDLVVWKEILTKSKDEKLDIIFVLDDRKEDWWLEHQGKTICPRPELLKEFRNVTNQKCHFYKPFQFLEYSVGHLGSDIKQEILDEVKNYIVDIKDESSLSVEIIVEGNVVNYDLFTDDLEAAGYRLLFETGDGFEGDGQFTCIVVLPKIPDLLRRLQNKYIGNLKKYNLTLVSLSLPEL